MEFYTNINNTNTNGENIDIQYIKEIKKEDLEEEEKVLSNMFGFIPKKYVKYFNIIAIEVFATLVFTLIYYILLQDFDTYFFVPKEFAREHFINNKFIVALFMSINFQTTTAYVDLKCKSIKSRALIMLQLVTTCMIAFFFISV
jgi:hypothetical protein